MTSRVILLLFGVLCCINLQAQRISEETDTSGEQRPFYRAALDFRANTDIEKLPEGGHDKDLYRTIEEWGPRLWPHGDANVAGTYIATYANNTNCVNVDNFATEGPLAGIDLQWKAIGLDGNDGPSDNYRNAAGQIHRFAFAPGFGTNNMTFYAATGFGGLWRTENNGDDWEVVNTDNQTPDDECSRCGG